MTRTEGAPHGRSFYLFIVALGLLGVACSIALNQNSEASLGWRILFAVPAIFFLVGVGQAVERIGWPQRARARTEGLTEEAELLILLARWGTLAVSLGGFGIASIVRIFVKAEIQDICDNVRILCFLLLFVCFCLADLGGDETFPQSMWSKAWKASPDDPRGLSKTRRRSI